MKYFVLPYLVVDHNYNITHFIPIIWDKYEDFKGFTYHDSIFTIQIEYTKSVTDCYIHCSLNHYIYHFRRHTIRDITCEIDNYLDHLIHYIVFVDGSPGDLHDILSDEVRYCYDKSK